MRVVTRRVDRVLAGAIGVLAAASLLAAEPVNPRQAELTHLVRQDCGSFHGMTLKAEAAWIVRQLQEGTLGER